MKTRALGLSALGLSALALAGPMSASVPVEKPTQVTAILIDASGGEVGWVRLREDASRGLVVTVEVSGLQLGAYHVVIHEWGRCETPTFDTAGATLDEGGEAALRFDVPGPGRVEVERVARNVTLAEGDPNSLLDADGSAFVVYSVDGSGGEPFGDAGATRGAAVACAVVSR